MSTCEARRLSTGKVLGRLWDLREEVFTYLQNEDSELAKYFQDQQWFQIVDILTKFTTLNRCLQGQNNSILDLDGRK